MLFPLKTPFVFGCGREWPTISRIVGRTNEKLLLPDGSWVGGAFFQNAFEQLPELKRYQIHQLDTDYLLVRLRTSTRDYLEKYHPLLEDVRQKIRHWTGVPFRIEFEKCETFERTATGKELVFIQKSPIGEQRLIRLS
jgi:phenylacetate-coenzyme A ligase PaaK-like adenylate-forming protein